MPYTTETIETHTTNTCFSSTEECLLRLDWYQQIYFKEIPKRFQVRLFDKG